MLRRTIRFYAPIIINMPALSPTMEKGTLTSWEKAVGDLVKSEDALARVQTDKAVVDFNFVGDEFYLARLLAETGEKVEVGQPVALGVEEKDELGSDEVKNWKAPEKAKAPEPEKKAAAAAAPKPAATPAALKPAAAPAAPSKPGTISDELHETIERSGPAVMRLAASLTADQLTQFFGSKKGSGLGGRFTKSDVVAAFPSVDFETPNTSSPLHPDPSAVNKSSTPAPEKKSDNKQQQHQSAYVTSQDIQPGAVYKSQRDDNILEFLINHS